MKSLRLILIGLLLCALHAAPLRAAASPVIVDYDRQGSLEIQLEAPPEHLPGLVFSLYRIGDIDNTKGGISYDLSSAFRGAGVTLDYETNQQAEEAARRIAAFIDAEGIKARATSQTNPRGEAVFLRLEPGVYFAQATGGLGQLIITPFIVSVPLFEDGGLEYAVKVYPKTELRPTPTPEPKPSPTPGPGGKLPQTGLLRWPVIALGVASAALITGGIRLLVKKPRDEQDQREED